MARISLAGPSYTSRSVVAAVQQTMNLVPEPVEVGNEPAKLVLYGRSGLKLFTTLTPNKIRCLWAGGGRLFAINGGNETEIHQDGSVTVSTGTVAQGTTSPDPAQIFSNGHQLMIVSGGQTYCDNGSGPVAVKQIVSGNGNTSSGSPGGILVYITPSTGVAWAPGDPPGPFLPAWQGGPINIDNTWYTMTGVVNDHTIDLNVNAPNATNVVWKTPQGSLLDGVTGAFLDGYFIVNRVYNSSTAPAGSQPGRMFNISNLNDGTMWDPADFAVKEGAADNIRSVLADSEQLWIFGEESTEIWTNVGDPNFPFQRITGAMIHKGSVATYAPESAGLSVCWLAGGDDGQTIALQARGLQPQRISTYAQETAWNGPGFTVSDAVTYSYSDGGHVFWVVCFWAQQACWVYDLTTAMWHERAAWDAVNKVFLRYMPWFHVFLPGWGTGGMHIVGDPATGKLYQQSVNYYTDDGAAIEYLRAMPHLINENEYAYHHRLEVLAEMGNLASTDPVPLMGLDWSDDHGHTWNDTISRQISMAASGDYKRRAAFRRLGKARDRVYRVGIQASVKISLIDTYLEMTQGFA